MGCKYFSILYVGSNWIFNTSGNSPSVKAGMRAIPATKLTGQVPLEIEAVSTTSVNPWESILCIGFKIASIFERNFDCVSCAAAMCYHKYNPGHQRT